MPPFIIIPIVPLVSIPPYSVRGLSVEGRGLSSRACCCDLDFKAETVLVLTVREHCSWPSLAGPLLGPSVWWHLGVQVSMHISACFLWRSCWLCRLAYCVCVMVPATKGGLFVLVQVGGWEWGLLGPHPLLYSGHASLPPFSFM